MIEIKLSDLQKRIKENQTRNQGVIREFHASLSNECLTAGRQRPRHPTEEKILNLFTRK